MKDQEVVDDFANWLSGYASRAAALGSEIEETKLVNRFLMELPKRFIHMVASIEQLVDLKTIDFDDVVGWLKAYEERVKDEETQAKQQNQLLFAGSEEKAKENEHKCEHCGCSKSNCEDYGRGGRGYEKPNDKNELIPIKEYSEGDKKEHSNEPRMITLLQQYVREDILFLLQHDETSKSMWEALKVKAEGGKDIKKNKISLLKKEFDLFSCMKGETSLNEEAAKQQMIFLASILESYERSLVAGKIGNPNMKKEDYDQIDPEEIELIDIRWCMTIVIRRAHRFMEITGRTCLGGAETKLGFDKSKPPKTNQKQIGEGSLKEKKQALVVTQDDEGFNWNKYIPEKKVALVAKVRAS
ncbi:uncharacterized protein LOC110876172 [Helianthus annuus]|uniref:uncharacterized protein LOC110876172 n=1 Tax=Helianthus annuus TaxID=4232 RepID=UPI000B8FD005|nr:uncharacterized protein LOC110876172 [Helianthus annuus]